MKKILFILLLITANNARHAIFAQAPGWLWAKSAGGAAYDAGQSIATDPDGNVYVTGEFYSPSITFGSITLVNDSLSTPDIFVVKYDSSGNVNWAIRAGGALEEKSYAIAVDGSGNVYVTGGFASDSLILGSDTLRNGGYYRGSFDIFVVKYDSSGHVSWARKAGGQGGEYGNSIAADSSGNVYVTGASSSAHITFNSFITLNNSGTLNIFVVKYDSWGSVLWAKRAGGSYSDRGDAIAVDGGGNVYVAGTFSSSSITFGNFNWTVVNFGNNDIFLTKYGASGNLQWAKRAGGTWDDRVNSIAIDGTGNVYLTGSFGSDSILFGSVTLTNASIANNDLFVVKYDSSGNALWAKRSGGTAGDGGFSVTTDASENVYVTGQFTDSITFGNVTLTNSGNGDIFIVKYNSSGHVLWAKGAGGVNYEAGLSIASDANSNVYITGSFSSSSITFGTQTFVRAGADDIYIAKLAPANCSSYYSLYPDTTPQNWIAVNQANGVPPLSYSWNWGDSTTSTGGTPSHTYGSAGNYAIGLTITDAAGCINMYCDSSTNLLSVNVSPLQVGINDQGDNENSITIYPNPACSEFLVFSSRLKVHHIEIFDLLGHKVYCEPFLQNKIEISLLPKGVYFVKISTDKVTTIKKLLVYRD